MKQKGCEKVKISNHLLVLSPIPSDGRIMIYLKNIFLYRIEETTGICVTKVIIKVSLPCRCGDDKMFCYERPSCGDARVSILRSIRL